MHILVTNDDGIYSKGLLALAQVMRNYGEVSILAPDRNWSSSGHVKTLNRPLRIYKTELEDGSPAMICDGSPADCVAIASMGVVDGKIDLVVSGVNTSANLGHDVTYSGTVTAAMEAAIHGINGIAFSQDRESDGVQNFEVSQHVAEKVMDLYIEKKPPSDIFLNVNIPNLTVDQLKGVE
ncbi:MAG: 5'/3'-nucleotidase SurE, partial [Chloroflexota bacterium]